MIEKFLDNPITKDKTIEVRSYVETRVDTGGQTWDFNVNEWLDRSDSPETLSMHTNLKFLGLTINKRVTISKNAQKDLDSAAVAIRELNHTDVPHRMARSERDTLHELS